MEWNYRSRKVRSLSVKTLRWMDGLKPNSTWGRPLDVPFADWDGDEAAGPPSETGSLRIETDVPCAPSCTTPLTQKPSARSRGRPSVGGINELMSL